MLVCVCVACRVCDLGYVAATAGASTCTACNPGQYRDAGLTVCTDCPAGTYSSGTGAAACKPCPAGTISAAGASSCTACDVGKTSAPGSSSCTDCPKGEWRAWLAALLNFTSTWSPVHEGLLPSCSGPKSPRSYKTEYYRHTPMRVCVVPTHTRRYLRGRHRPPHLLPLPTRPVQPPGRPADLLCLPCRQLPELAPHGLPVLASRFFVRQLCCSWYTWCFHDHTGRCDWHRPMVGVLPEVPCGYEPAGRGPEWVHALLARYHQRW